MKKFFAGLLACLMIMSSFPAVVFAEEEVHDHDHAAVSEEEAKCPGAGKQHDKENSTATKIKTVNECGKQGYTVYACDVCGDQFPADFTEAGRKEHEFREVPDSGKAPTCIADGHENIQACVHCGVELPGEVIPSKGDHTWEETPEVFGNCVAGGYVEYDCIYCDGIKKEDIEGTGWGHAWGIGGTSNKVGQAHEILKAPTCAEEGLAYYECINEGCHDTKEIAIKNDRVPHSNFTDVPAKAPTCTVAGNTAYTQCGICGVYFAGSSSELGGEIKQDSWILPALNHPTMVKDEEASKDPTCTEAGKLVTYCAVCKDHTVTKELPATGHDYQVTENIEADCQTAGYKKEVCSKCGDVIETRTDKNPDQHPKGAIATSIVPATCTTYGYTSSLCKLCGNNWQSETVSPLGHTFLAEDGAVEVERVEPTCETDGRSVMSCGRCHSAKKTTVLPATGHELVTDDSRAQGNCSRIGYTFTYCTNDNCDLDKVTSYTYYDVEYDVTVGGKAVQLHGFAWAAAIDANNHIRPETENYLTYNKPTCTEPGSEAWICTGCDKYQVNTLPAIGHKILDAADIFTDDKRGLKLSEEECAAKGVKVLALATCTDKLSVSVSCTNECGEFETYIGEALGHDYAKTTVVAPLCNAQGYTLHECVHAGCGASYKDAHTTFVFKASYPTLEEAEKDHAHMTLTDTERQDCTLGNIYVYECSDCNKVILITETPTDAHTLPASFDAGLGEFAAQAPTCTEKGRTAQYHCTKCNTFVESVEIPATGHAWVETAAKAPTCTEAGNIAYVTCSRCNKHFADQTAKDELTAAQLVVSAKGHEWVSEKGLNATCEEAGYTAYLQCSICDTIRGKDAIPATGHNQNEIIPAVPATCYKEGLTQGAKCDACGKITVEPESVAMIDHSYNHADDEIVPPTCDKQGYTISRCYVCDAQDNNVVDSINSVWLHSFVPATNHADAEIVPAVPAGCENTGLTEGLYCSDCDTWLTAQEVVPAIGHKNAAGEVLPGSCEAPVTDRMCVGCKTEIAFTHDAEFEVREFYNEDCTKEGYAIEYCPVCGVVDESTLVLIPARTHVFGEWVETLKPTQNNVGEETRVCTNAGCKVKETRPVEALAGITYSMSVQNALDNANQEGKAIITDSSRIAVTISLESLAGVYVWGTSFKIDYDPAVLTYTGFEFVNADRFASAGNPSAVVSGKNASVTAFLSASNEAGLPDEVLVTESEAILTLYFVVNNKSASSTELSFRDIETYDLEANPVTDEHKDVDVVIHRFLDIDGNGVANIADILTVYNALGQSTDVAKNAAVDINKNGKVDATDLNYLFQYFNAQISYDELVEIGIKAQVPMS